MIDAEMPARMSSPILIGRVPEMAALQEALGRAEGGSPMVVLVGGEAGIGKTRIVAEVAQDARQRGHVVLVGGCASIGSGEGLPFAPIAEALRGIAPVRGPSAAGRGRSIPRPVSSAALSPSCSTAAHTESSPMCHRSGHRHGCSTLSWRSSSAWASGVR